MPARTFSADETGEQMARAHAAGGVAAPGLLVALAAIEVGWLAVLGVVLYRLAAHGSV